MATLIGRQGSPFPAYFYFIFLYFRYWLPLPFPDASLPKKIPFHFPPLNLQSPSIHQGRSCLTLVHQCYSHSSAAPSSEVSTELHVGWPLKYFNTSLLHFFTTLAASFPTSPPQQIFFLFSLINHIYSRRIIITLNHLQLLIHCFL